MNLRKEGNENPKFYKYQFLKILKKSCEIFLTDLDTALTKTRKREPKDARFFAYAVFFKRYNEFISIERMADYTGHKHCAVLHMKKKVADWVETNYLSKRNFEDLEEWSKNNTEIFAPIITKKDVNDFDLQIQEFKLKLNEEQCAIFNEILEEKERRVFAIIK